jgi:hypothetical protein
VAVCDAVCSGSRVPTATQVLDWTQTVPPKHPHTPTSLRGVTPHNFALTLSVHIAYNRTGLFHQVRTHSSCLNIRDSNICACLTPHTHCKVNDVPFILSCARQLCHREPSSAVTATVLTDMITGTPAPPVIAPHTQSL